LISGLLPRLAGSLTMQHALAGDDGWRPALIRHFASLMLLVATISFGAIVGGCSQLPGRQDLSHLARHSAGRIAVRVEGDAARSMSASFELRGDADAGLLELSSPLGTQLAQASWQRGRIQLATSDGVRLYPSLDELAGEAFGQPLPMAALFDWLKARAWPGAPATALVDEAGYTQLGWQVHLGRYDEGLIIANRAQPEPAITVRVKLDPA
jgi:outer membrane lipoprotein LolB